LQKSDYDLPFEEIKVQLKDDKNIELASSSNGTGGAGKISDNEIAPVYLSRKTQSLSLQQRREGIPNKARRTQSN